MSKAEKYQRRIAKAAYKSHPLNSADSVSESFAEQLAEDAFIDGAKEGRAETLKEVREKAKQHTYQGRFGACLSFGKLEDVLKALEK